MENISQPLSSSVAVEPSFSPKIENVEKLRNKYKRKWKPYQFLTSQEKRKLQVKERERERMKNVCL